MHYFELMRSHCILFLIDVSVVTTDLAGTRWAHLMYGGWRMIVALLYCIDDVFQQGRRGCEWSADSRLANAVKIFMLKATPRDFIAKSLWSPFFNRKSSVCYVLGFDPVHSGTVPCWSWWKLRCCALTVLASQLLSCRTWSSSIRYINMSILPKLMQSRVIFFSKYHALSHSRNVCESTIWNEILCINSV